MNLSSAALLGRRHTSDFRGTSSRPFSSGREYQSSDGVVHQDTRRRRMPNRGFNSYPQVMRCISEYSRRPTPTRNLHPRPARSWTRSVSVKDAPPRSGRNAHATAAVPELSIALSIHKECNQSACSRSNAHTSGNPINSHISENGYIACAEPAVPLRARISPYTSLSAFATVKKPEAG